MCSVFQRYNLKAIHNGCQRVFIQHLNVLSISKIQSKSNSQHNDDSDDKAVECAQYFKDTI